ncbi:phosphate acyltransferase PlsX [Yunchengibacter salinarum]|uniref:phosphate acyltransferase PlsX n=1 Tax=Yunchengibacter salinarum TaxID=3133399 RepID=UPI0035B66F10
MPVGKSITIAVDAMGGDHGPDTVLAGLAQARSLYPDITFLIYGDDSVNTALADHPALEGCSTVHVTETQISADDKPSQALRRGRDSSMGRAIQAVKSGEADVAVSAGNTGALMALAKFILRTQQGIDRPALISPIPTLRGESVMLDLGANLECDAHNLAQFAVMGAAYVRTVLGLSTPSVGLLNVGVEELKGKEAIREAGQILRHSNHLNINFQGFVEGTDISSGRVDVIVTDGFTGNVALKTTEGTARFIGTLLEQAFRSSLMTKLGYALARPGLQSLRDHLDPNNHNGGVFMGLNGLVVKSHGGANVHGIASAVSTAREMARNNLISLVGDELTAIVEDAPENDENGGA